MSTYTEAYEVLTNIRTRKAHKDQLPGIDSTIQRNSILIPEKQPQKPETLTLEQVLGHLARGEVNLTLSNDDTVVLDREVPEWLMKAVTLHQENLKPIVKVRTIFKLIDDYTTKLRYDDPTKGTRPQAFAWLGRKLREFEGLCDLPNGYFDPSDPFADSALSTLRHEYAELTAEGNPYPIPRDDPRPRFPNGKLEQTSA